VSPAAPDGVGDVRRRRHSRALAPVLCVSSDLTHARLHVHECGPPRAVRASISFQDRDPGLRQRLVLVDGAVLNNCRQT
jgi:predicted acylesterase/phospholipase RssA